MFADELAQQPQSLLDLVEFYRNPSIRSTLSAIGESAMEHSITFTGMGSSLYVASSILPMFRQAGWRAERVEAGEALHYALPGWRPRGLLAAVSQSGESAETRALSEALAEAGAGSLPIIAITNDPESGLACAVRWILPICAGEEAAISTKTYTNSLGVLLLLAGVLVGRDLDAALAELVAAAAGMATALRPEIEGSIDRAAEWIDAAKSVHFIGRGPSVAAASSGALIIGEGARVTAVGLPAASFRHGPMELADEDHAAVLFIPEGSTRPLMEKLRFDLSKTGSRTVTLTDRASAQLPDGALEIVMGVVPTEAHFPLVAALGVERILASVAERRGLIPGDFRYGEKVTSKE